MTGQKERIFNSITRLYQTSRQVIKGIGEIEYVKTDYTKINDFPKTGWEIFAKEDRIKGKDSHYWLRANFTTPNAEEDEYFVLSVRCGREGQASIVNPQSLLYLNGEIVQGIDTNHFEAPLSANTDYNMIEYLYTGNVADPFDRYYQIIKINRKVECLYYDIKIAYEAATLLNEFDGNKTKLLAVIDQAIDVIDFSGYDSNEFLKSIDEAQKIVTSELYGKMCFTEGMPTVTCLGHTHIDVEWLWSRKQTREKIQRSFANAMALMKEYPEYTFMLSQPNLYQYLKEDAPELYSKLKELVAAGRWEPEGAMYLEADCNLTSGESLVRQIMHGKKFFKDEFGVDSKVLFLPDVFGYSAALPQILKKSGIDYFVTSKISWNDTNTVPYDTFMWRGIDGTEIFTDFITTQKYTGEKPNRYTIYGGFLSASDIKGTWNRYQNKDYIDNVLHTFGHGDGGGGPTKEMLETQRRLAKGLPGIPPTKMGFLVPFLKDIRNQFDIACIKNRNTPRWVGELYLERHRGTLTSMGIIKRMNRKCEFSLEKAETLSYIGLQNGMPYDQQGFYDNWATVLHNQFHDIIPGSSIEEVYNYALEDYKNVKDFCDNIIDDSIKNITNNLSTDGGAFVYNSLGFPCAGDFKIDGKTYETSEIIPAFGWKVISEYNKDNRVKLTDNSIENELYYLEIDKTGRIVSLKDKQNNREVFINGAFGNEIQIFEDNPHEFDNWEICEYYDRKMRILDGEAQIEKVVDGTRSGLKITKNYHNSKIVQTIWLYSVGRRIDFENDIDWHEHHQLVKIAFPFDLNTNEATYEIQYGNITRPTHRNTSWDEARFEVCGHKWVDLSENGYGVSLLNDCKYGYSADGSTLKLTALKCGTYPNQNADQGKHVFVYSLIPHSGSFQESGIIHESYLLNQPLSAAKVEKTQGTLPETFSMVSCNRDHVIMEVVKKSESDDGMIVRMYESINRRTDVTVTVPANFKKAFLCDLTENVIEELEICNGSVKLPIRGFEIITLKFVQ